MTPNDLLNRWPLAALTLLPGLAVAQTKNPPQLGKALLKEILAALTPDTTTKRLKTLRGLTSREFVWAQWQKNPTIFKPDPTHLTLGLRT